MGKVRSMMGTKVYLDEVDISHLVYSIKVGGACSHARMAEVVLYAKKVSTDDDGNMVVNLGTVE